MPDLTVHLRFMLERVPCTLCLLAALTLSACAPNASITEVGAESEAALDVEDAGLLPTTPIHDDSLSNEAILELIRGRKYRGPGFVAVNRTPFPSTVSPSKKISLWVSEAGYDAMTKVSSDNTASNVSLPVGTVIVRDVLNDGALDTITVMVKLPKGAFPLGGDWWYAAADPDGKIRLDSKQQAPLAGLLQNCGTCHLRRSEDDFVFGAPKAYLP